jgi:hypothetical protein
MKSLIRGIFMGAALFALAVASSWAGTTPGSGIDLTSHDFTQSNNPNTTTPVGVCTFCHTPHKAISTLLLWNHTLSTNSFAWDVPATTAGTLFPTIVGDTYRGPTAKCLSCHDGSVAIGDVAWFMEEKPAAPLNPMTHPDGDAFNIGFGGNMAGNHACVSGLASRSYRQQHSPVQR